MIDVLMATGAFYLIAAAISGFLVLGLFVFIFTSVIGAFNDVRKDFTRYR